MIRLNLSFLLKNDNFKIEFEIPGIFLVLENSDDFIRLDKIHIDHLEKAHASFRFLLQNPEQPLIDIFFVFKLSQ